MLTKGCVARSLPPSFCRLVTAFFFCGLSSIAQGEALTDGAFALIHARIEAGKEFFLYRDADSAYNHGAFSGRSGVVAAVHLDPACLDDATTATGCVTDPLLLDRTRGTVLQIRFEPLASDQFAAVALEEPPLWATHHQGKGYDLRGCRYLVFEARSPSPCAINVQFGLANRQTKMMTIAAGPFQPIAISLDSLGLTESDLASVHQLFTVAVSGQHLPGGGTLLLDNIRLDPAPSSQTGVPNLPLANETFGILPAASPATGRVTIPPDQVNRNSATIYETSLAVLTLLQRGSDQDRILARRLLDSLGHALHHDNAGLPLPTGKGGGLGLHDGYRAGDLAATGGPGTSEGESRLAGYSAPHCGPSGYCVILDGATGGNNAFAVLAFLAGYHAFHAEKYLDEARSIATWITSNLRDDAGFGGYFFGYSEGAIIPKKLIRGKSTENNADIFAAFSRLAEVEKKDGREDEAGRWAEQAAWAGDFVLAMHNSKDGSFYAGTIPAGSAAGPGVLPLALGRGGDVINGAAFLDATTFAILALAPAERYRQSLDWDRAAAWVLGQCATTVSAAGHDYLGCDLSAGEKSGPAGIAWEFTGQAAVVLDWAGKRAGPEAGTFREAAARYRRELARAQRDSPFGDGLGLVAGTLQDGDRLPPREQCLSTPFQCIPARVGMAATLWAILAERGGNPF